MSLNVDISPFSGSSTIKISCFLSKVICICNLRVRISFKLAPVKVGADLSRREEQFHNVVIERLGLHFVGDEAF